MKSTLSHLYLLNCDWLQFSCHFSGDFPLEYKIVYKERSTRVFKTWCQLYFLDTHFADLWFNPSSSILHKNLCSVKISNEMLYHPELFVYVRNLIKLLKLTNISISRFDLCCDFQEFINNYEVDRFMKDLINSKILYNCRSQFKVCGVSSDFQTIHSLSFGSRSSYIYVTLYDKTKEMRDVAVKNYIQKQWFVNNFDMSKPVWRLEFSINQNSEQLVNESSGDIFNITLDFISKQFNLFHLFKILVNKKFSFKKNENKTNKSRNSNVKLFDTESEKHSIVRLDLHRNITRSNKIHVNRSVKYILSLSPMQHHMKLLNVKCLFHYLSVHNMFDFFEKNYKDLCLFNQLSESDKIICSTSNNPNFALFGT